MSGCMCSVRAGETRNSKQPPARAIGLTWVALNPAPRSLPLSIDTQPIYRPRTTATILGEDDTGCLGNVGRSR